MLAGCGQGAGGNASGGAVRNATTAVRSTTDQPLLVPSTPASTPAKLIDPRSGEAAKEALRQAAAGVETGRVANAKAMLTPTLQQKLAREGGVERLLTRYRDVRAEIGSASAPEGAAGSSYVSLPLHLRFSKGGKPGEAFGSVTMKRVNDVPGATADQLRWRIDDFVLGKGGPRRGAL